MKEPYRKGVAKRSNPESCADGGNIAVEASTGAHGGQSPDAAAAGGRALAAFGQQLA